MSKNELGRWVERELAARDWSQSELARRSGLNQGHISRIINYESAGDKAICGRKTALALADVFEASEIYVLRLAKILSPPRRSRNFSTWLVGELLNKGLEQDELARRAELEPKVIANLTRGVPPSSGQITALARALDIDPVRMARIAGNDVDLLNFSPTQEELKLLQMYRELSARQKKLLRDILITIKDNG
jgi:transcriptional regulator with XRE-family HTH domain